LDVGVSRTLKFARATSGLTIPSTLSDAEYLIVFSNLNTDNDPQYSYTVSGDWLAANPSADLLAPRGSLTPWPTATAAEQFEQTVRLRERSTLRLAPLGLRPRAAILPGSAAQDLSVGDKLTIHVNGVTGDGCTNQPVTTGIVRYISQHAIFVIDSIAPGNGQVNGTGFSTADLQAIGQDFDGRIYPTDTSYFGAPSDFDQNGKVIIYYTPQVNLLTPRTSTSGRIGGFFFAGDLYPVTGNPHCSSSNEGEIFYLLAPDPNAVYSTAVTVTQVRNLTRGTIAHEFQHMINAGNRLFKSNATEFESAWLDEGLAHFAEDAVGRVEAGFTDLQMVTVTNLQSMNSQVQSSFFLQNLARSKIYITDPTNGAPVSSESKVGRGLGYRGAAWSFLRYAADWFSGNDPRTLTRKLAFGPDTGVANITKQTGQPLDTLLSRWLLTIGTDTTFTGIPAQFRFRSYDWHSVLTRLDDGSGNSGTYTLPIHSIGSGTNSITATFPGTSGAFFLTSQAGTGTRTITIAPSTDSTGRIYILRVK